MPDKLSQSLDQIMSDRRKTNRPRRTRPGVKATVAPTSGVTKKIKQAERKPQKVVPTGPSNKESKVQVSNLVCNYYLDGFISSKLTSSLATRRERGSDQGMLMRPIAFLWTSLPSCEDDCISSTNLLYAHHGIGRIIQPYGVIAHSMVAFA
jgi:hypothetical protein